jgi:protein tyrosine/serine phosphatase
VIKRTIRSVLLFTCFLSQLAFASPCSKDNDSGIKNFCVVSKENLWRGGKPSERGAAWLIDNGIKSVVNLELLYDDLPSLLNAKVAPSGVAEIAYFKVRNWEPIAAVSPKLQDQHVARFLAIMASSPKPVYVHCRSGQNRTGVNVAAYRMLVEGMDTETAVAEMKTFKGHWSTVDAKYLRSIDASRKQAILAMVEKLKESVKPLATVRCQGGGCQTL